MSLNWDLSKVQDYDDLFYKDTENGQEIERMDAITESLIFASITVGISSIIEKNAEKFWKRLRILELAGGARIRHADGRKHYITLDEVRRRIGMSTNASSRTDSDFLENVFAIYGKSLKDDPEPKQEEVK